MLPAETLQKAAYTLRVLTHPDRLRICDLLLENRYTVSELCKAARLKQNVVSQHLNHLRAHGIVEPRREGRHVRYEVIHPAAAWLLECIGNHCCETASGQQTTTVKR